MLHYRQDWAQFGIMNSPIIRENIARSLQDGDKRGTDARKPRHHTITVKPNQFLDEKIGNPLILKRLDKRAAGTGKEEFVDRLKLIPGDQ
jgi:hypothetical protein